MPRGGTVGNKGGRPKGSKEPQTIAKELAKERLRQRVFAEQDGILDAQLANAKGIKYLVIREKKSGKFVKRITEAGEELNLNPDTETVEVYAKDPSVQAFAYLFDQAMDRAAQPTQDVNLKMPAMEAILARLVAGRERIAKRG